MSEIKSYIELFDIEDKNKFVDMITSIDDKFIEINRNKEVSTNGNQGT